MSENDQTQIYLITPPVLEDDFGARLSSVLDAGPVACLRLSLATTQESVILRGADLVREIAHVRDIPVVIEDHGALVERMGLDGVHLTGGARLVRHWRGELGADDIVGAYAHASRHDGLSAGEAGADYVSFGPVRPTGLGDGSVAQHDIFEWWSEVIELPIVAEGALDLETARQLAPITDFLALGAEIWNAEDAAAELRKYLSAIG